MQSLHLPVDFNSRTSCEVRQHGRTAGPNHWHFNSRTSCEVRLRRSRINPQAFRISTHAPLARCDTHAGHFRAKLLHFNSRTSCEVRHARVDFAEVQQNFNSRTSCEVRQKALDRKLDIAKFQLTHLLRGATVCGGGARREGGISTHAPLARCDFFYGLQCRT